MNSDRLYRLGNMVTLKRNRQGDHKGEYQGGDQPRPYHIRNTYGIAKHSSIVGAIPCGRPALALALIMLLLLAACSPFGGSGSTTDVKPTPVPTQLPTQAPLNTAADVCPAGLKTVPNCFTPHSMRVAYGVESLFERGFTGKGQTIIDIVSFGSPTLQQDLDVYDKQFGLPPIKLTILSPLNVPTYDPYGDRGGWASETTLDVEIFHAIAPDANIVVLTSPVAETEGTVGLPEFRQLVQYVIDHHLGNIISQSWGASEATLKDAAGQQEVHKWDDLFHQATTQDGITFFTASGDHGATDVVDQRGRVLSPTPTVAFPADDPWNTTVGGTSLSDSGGTISETAWVCSKGASICSEGGFSAFFPTPDYQKLLPASVQSELHNRRGIPDVAGSADPSGGLALYFLGHWTFIGGTSASAPLWAGIGAVANQMAGHPLGFINPALYKVATSSKYNQDFRDITVGNNDVNSSVKVKGYPAVPGWDPVTGFGSPIADKLLPDLIAAAQR